MSTPTSDSKLDSRPLFSQRISTEGNYAEKTSFGRYYYRLIAYQGEIAWMMRVAKIEGDKFSFLNPNKETKKIFAWSSKKVDELLSKKLIVHVNEMGIPKQMSGISAPSMANPKLDHKIKIVEYIHNNWGPSVFWSREINHEAFHCASEKFSHPIQTIRHWYKIYIFYGRHANSLIPRNWDKGAPDVPRRGKRNVNGKLSNVGRPTSNQLLDKNSIIKTKQVSKKRAKEFCDYVEKEGNNNKYKLSQIIRNYRSSRFGFNRDKNGDVAQYPIDPKYLPSVDSLRKIGQRIFAQIRFERELNKNKSNGGGAQILAAGDLAVFDLDATRASIYLKVGPNILSEDGKKINPLILLATDRGSGAIVGWDISFSEEDTNAYKRCLFNAYANKNYELTRWGLCNLKGMVSGIANQIFVDRGPCVSEEATKTISKNLRIDGLMAAPGFPEGKPNVERAIGLMQQEFIGEKGEYNTTGDKDLDRVKYKKAKNEKNALSINMFMKILLKAISSHNCTMDARSYITREMFEHEVAPVPKEIFEFNQNKCRGDNATRWPEEEFIRRLCARRDNLKAPAGIVTIEGRNFTCSLLQDYANLFTLKNNKTATISVLELPHSQFSILWCHENGKLIELTATLQTMQLYVNDFSWANNHRNIVQKARLNEAQYKHRKIVTNQTKEKNNFKISANKQKEIENAERRSNGVNNGIANKIEKKIVQIDHGLQHADAINEQLEVTRDNKSLTPKLPSSHAGGLVYDNDEKLSLDF